jgi:hypothetical protein
MNDYPHRTPLFVIRHQPAGPKTHRLLGLKIAAGPGGAVAYSAACAVTSPIAPDALIRSRSAPE